MLEERDAIFIGNEVVDGYEKDVLSRQEWEDELEEGMKLALQVVENKTFPWPGAANVKYPLITIAALQYSSRAYPALIPGVNVVKARPIGYDYDGSKTAASIRISKHMSYQVLEEMEDWEEEMDRLCVALPILGSMFKKTYYSNVEGSNVSEVIWPKDFVVNYWTRSLEKAPRKTHVIQLSENDVFERVASGLFAEGSEELEEGTNRETAFSDELNGLNRPQGDEEDAPLEFLEQHTYFDLDGDGYKEPYIATVHYKSHKLCRLVPRFSINNVFVNENGDIRRIVADEYFTKYGFIPNPDGGFYDIGFSKLLGPINHSINTIINQLLDAGTLSNLQSGFLAKGIRLRKGDSNFQPGEWKSVNVLGDDLRKGIYPLPVREPSNVLFTLLGTLIDVGKQVGSSTDIMLGENPGQNQPAHTTMAVLEQGMKVFNSIYKRQHRSLKKEFKKLFVLNSLYLSPESYFTVLDNEQGATIFNTDYDVNSVNVLPFSDPNISSEAQRLAKVQGLMELLQLGTINRMVVTKRVLEAQEQPGIEELMQLPPPQPSLEQQQLQFDMEKFKDEAARGWAKLELDSAKVENDSLSTESKSMLDLSKVDLNTTMQALETLKQSLEETKVEYERRKPNANGMESPSNN